MTVQEGGDQRVLAVNEGYRRANLWWRADRGGAAIADDGTKSENGNSYDVLTVTPQGGKKLTPGSTRNPICSSGTVEQQGPQTIVTTSSG